MGVYQALQAKIKPVQKDIDEFPKSLGGRVMEEASKKGWTAQNNMPEILDAFHKALIHFNWRWTPRKACGDQAAAAKTLDGSVVNAECFVPANAFYQLLMAPAPYGFGVSADKVKVASYSGESSIIGGDPPDGPNLQQGWKRVPKTATRTLCFSRRIRSPASMD